MAQNYSRRWQDLSLSSTGDHIVSEWGNDGTWGLLYNLYAVRLIEADFIPPKVGFLKLKYDALTSLIQVYELQASWFRGSDHHIPTGVYDWPLSTSSLP
jgi:hypothetical protein